jgi:hypothetical protein
MGLLSTARRVRRLCDFLAPSYWSRARRHRLAFEEFKSAYGDALRGDEPGSAGARRKKVLFLSTHGRTMETEIWLVKALTLAGLAPVVVMPYERRLLRRYYQLAGATETHLATEFSDDLCLAEAAEALVAKPVSIKTLMSHEYAGARVGQMAVSTAMRKLRGGSLDLADASTRRFLVRYLTAAMSTAVAAQRIVQRVRPAMAIVADCDYTPVGEMFDVCLAHGVDVVSYDIAHRSNTLLFKRHTRARRAEHRVSLSDATWQAMREMPWSDALAQRLKRELHDGYETRDWYSSAGTQFRSRHHERGALRTQLGLDPKKKTAVIFPHISWDAPFAWGTHLFSDYDDWLVATVRAACLNDHVNWVVKFHPANVKKSAFGNVPAEPTESATLRRHFGKLPPHVVIMPADSGVSTNSVFAIMDYCLTVRGTVGIEAAVRGIPVITGGTGRYDHRGFTIDSDTPEQYLERIADIGKIPPLTPGQQELAQRYAYGLFVLRPLRLASLTLQFHQGEDEFGRRCVRRENRIEARTRLDWASAPDIKALTRWLNDSTRIDFLMPEA